MQKSKIKRQIYESDLYGVKVENTGGYMFVCLTCAIRSTNGHPELLVPLLSDPQTPVKNDWCGLTEKPSETLCEGCGRRYLLSHAAMVDGMVANEYQGFEDDDGGLCLTHAVRKYYGGNAQDLYAACKGDTSDFGSLEAIHSGSAQYAASDEDFYPQGLTCQYLVDGEPCGSEIVQPQNLDYSDDDQDKRAST